MLNKLKDKFFCKKNKKLLQKTLEQLKSIRQNHNILVLYGSPTNGNWLGIANATKNLYPENSLEIPQWYSNSVFNQKESNSICGEIIKLNFEKIIISGFAPYFFLWIELLSPTQNIEIVFHGTISEFYDKEIQDFFSRLIKLTDKKKIKKIGFVKKGMAEVFQKLYGFDCYHQPLPAPAIPRNIKKISLDRSKIHIGVFGADTFNKNLHNQVINALMIENTIVHVLDKSIFSYLDKDDRIVEHGKNLLRSEFLSILGSMDLNLYMSYSESWGLIAYESEAMGVPCIQLEDVNYKQKIISIIENRK